MNATINEIYGTIPCTVTYSVLDTTLNTLFTRTVSNPPTPFTPPPCMTDPAFVEINACGTVFRVPLNTGGCCSDVILFCNCLPTPAWYTFHVCMIPLPGGMPCDYVIDIQI